MFSILIYVVAVLGVLAGTTPLSAQGHGHHPPPSPPDTAKPAPRKPTRPDSTKPAPSAPKKPTRPDSTKRPHTMHADTMMHAAPHDMMAMVRGPLGIPLSREGSGTSWLPDSTPVHALHAMHGPWMLMLHANVFAQYTRDEGDRGDDHFGSVNWVMGMARRPVGPGSLMFRTMLSLEPLTLGKCGYPNLLATGETCHGSKLHDKQHPHDLFMEVAAAYDRPVTHTVALQVYGGLVGEPALGPTAFMHRVSALPNPIAPIGHHWLDATHISFGVLTAGVFGRAWKLEGSVFNGREPDEERYDLDMDRLDSYSGRFWLLPNPRWAFQVSAGKLTEAERPVGTEPARDVKRITASAINHHPISQNSMLASTLAWGQNREADDQSNAYLAESNLTIGDRHIIFFRGEMTEKSGHDLVLADPLEHTLFTVSSISGGYVRQLALGSKLGLGVGSRVAVNVVPSDLESYYGSRSPVGFTFFLSVRPR